MSSTIFRKVRAVKSEITGTYRNGLEYTDTVYVLLAETAESNVYNADGSRCFIWSVYAYGSYLDVVKKVCLNAYYFEDGCSCGMAKSAESFIRKCKKALEDAETATELPCGVLGYISGIEHKFVFDAVKNHPGVKTSKWYGEEVLYCRDVAAFVTINSKISGLLKMYQRSVLREPDTATLEDWCNRHPDWLSDFFKTKKNNIHTD